MDRQDIELRDSLPGLVPDAAHEAVARDAAVEPEEITVDPAPAVPRVQDDLAAHLRPVELAEGEHLPRRNERNVDRHRTPHPRV